MRSNFLRGLVSYAAMASVVGVAVYAGGCKKGTATGGGGGPAGAGQAAQARAEAKTPKEAALAFSRALSAGNVERAKALSTGDAGPQMLETLATMASATDQLQKALKAKFGDAALKLEVFTESPDAAEELKRLTETVTGDSARIALSPTDKNATDLKKVGGEWKVDVTKYKEAASSAPQMRKIATAWNALAGEVKDGKFATVEEFKKAYDARTGAAAGG
jgi:hypothetical protein